MLLLILLYALSVEATEPKSAFNQHPLDWLRPRILTSTQRLKRVNSRTPSAEALDLPLEGSANGSNADSLKRRALELGLREGVNMPAYAKIEGNIREKFVKHQGVGGSLDGTQHEFSDDAASSETPHSSLSLTFSSHPERGFQFLEGDPRFQMVLNDFLVQDLESDWSFDFPAEAEITENSDNEEAAVTLLTHAEDIDRILEESVSEVSSLDELCADTAEGTNANKGNADPHHRSVKITVENSMPIEGVEDEVLDRSIDGGALDTFRLHAVGKSNTAPSSRIGDASVAQDSGGADKQVSVSIEYLEEETPNSNRASGPVERHLSGKKRLGARAKKELLKVARTPIRAWGTFKKNASRLIPKKLTKVGRSMKATQPSREITSTDHPPSSPDEQIDSLDQKDDLKESVSPEVTGSASKSLSNEVKTEIHVKLQPHINQQLSPNVPESRKTDSSPRSVQYSSSFSSITIVSSLSSSDTSSGSHVQKDSPEKTDAATESIAYLVAQQSSSGKSRLRGRLSVEQRRLLQEQTQMRTKIIVICAFAGSMLFAAGVWMLHSRLREIHVT